MILLAFTRFTFSSFIIYSALRLSSHQGTNGNYGVSGSNQPGGGGRVEIMVSISLLCTLILFARVQQSVVVHINSIRQGAAQ